MESDMRETAPPALTGRRQWIGFSKGRAWT
jgi:hypothetical protein